MTKLEKFVEANIEVLAVVGYGDNGGGGSNPTYEECPDCHLPKGHLGNHGNGEGVKDPSGTKPAEPSKPKNSGSFKVDVSNDKDGWNVKGSVSQKVGSWKFGVEGGYSEKNKWSFKVSGGVEW